MYDETDENKVHPSHCGTETYGLPEKPDFHARHFGKPAAYTKACFVQDLKAVLDEIEPDSIITTALCDTHGDHSGRTPSRSGQFSSPAGEWTMPV